MSADAATEKAEIPARYRNKGNLTEGSIKDHLIRLSIPMMWGIGVIISFQLVDMYFIGLLGTEQLAALSFTFPITYMIFSFLLGFGIAASSVVSRLIGGGEQEHEKVRRVATHSILFIAVLGGTIALAGLQCFEGLFAMLGASEELAFYIHDYMWWWFIGNAFLAIPLVGNSILRANGDTLRPALIMTGAAIINLILDPLLIFGLWGFPRLEMEGAAIATMIANICTMIWALLALNSRNLVARRYLVELKQFGNSIKSLLFIALPVGLTNTIQPFVNTVIISLLAKTGAEAVAAFGIASRIEAFAFIIIMGVAVGMAPIIGQNWGAKKYDRVKETLRLAFVFCVFWSLGVAVVLGVFYPFIASTFSDDAQVVEYTRLFFWIVPITYAFANIVHGWGSAFNAMGHPQLSFAIIVTKMLVLMLPAVYIGYYLGGVVGLFCAIASVNLVGGGLIHVLSWKKFKAWL